MTGIRAGRIDQGYNSECNLISGGGILGDRQVVGTGLALGTSPAPLSHS